MSAKPAASATYVPLDHPRRPGRANVPGPSQEMVERDSQQMGRTNTPTLATALAVARTVDDTTGRSSARLLHVGGRRLA